VWRLPLEEKKGYCESFLHMLGPDEVERANRFYFPTDREHFVVAHGMTRAILGSYLKVMPNELRFHYGSFGKPVLEHCINTDDLRFNLSHSVGLALLAVTREREIGIDLEYQRPGIASEGIAERFFSPAEVKSLRGLPKGMQTDSFFRCWTRKEAYIKAIGEGLSFPLDQFRVSLLPSELPELLEVVGNPQERTRWAFWDLAVSSCYAAALVIEGSNVRLRCFK
jgi:4'-phosphopantetheinyl transferase